MTAKSADVREDIPRDVLEERWMMAATKVTRFVEDGNGVSWDLSKRWCRVDRALDEFAALLVEDGFTDNDYDTKDGLLRVKERIWGVIHDELVAWAEEHERGRWTPRRRVHKPQLTNAE